MRRLEGDCRIFFIGKMLSMGCAYNLGRKSGHGDSRIMHTKRDGDLGGEFEGKYIPTSHELELTKLVPVAHGCVVQARQILVLIGEIFRKYTPDGYMYHVP